MTCNVVSRVKSFEMTSSRAGIPNLKATIHIVGTINNANDTAGERLVMVIAQKFTI